MRIGFTRLISCESATASLRAASKSLALDGRPPAPLRGSNFQGYRIKPRQIALERQSRTEHDGIGAEAEAIERVGQYAKLSSVHVYRKKSGQCVSVKRGPGSQSQE